MRLKFIKVINIITLVLFVIGCSTPGQKKQSSESSVDTKTEKRESLVSGGSQFDKLSKEKSETETDIEYIKKEEIIKTDVVATNPVSSINVRDFKVNITQIDNSKFPLVTLSVSVTDKNGSPLVVNKDFFQIEEHGELISKKNIISIVQQKQSAGVGENLPLNILLAIDKSGSMSGGFKDPEKQPMWFAKTSAIEFIKQIKGLDLINVIAFDGDIHSLSANEGAIDLIRNLKPRGSTALYGALLTGVKQLQIGGGVKAMILLSDGKNDTRGTINKAVKTITLQDGIHAADQLAIPVFTIGFGKNFDDFTLKKIARDTHALFFKTADKEEIQNLYGQIRNIINTQYLITYRSTSLQVVTDVTARLGKHLDRRSFTTPDHVIKERKELLDKIAVVEKEKRRLAAAERKLVELEAKLGRRNAFIEGEKTRLKGEEQKVREERKRLRQKEDELNKYDDAVKKLETKAIDENKRLARLSNELDGREGELNSTETRLNQLSNALNKRETGLDTKDEKLKQKDKYLGDRENLIQSKSDRLKETEKTLNKKSTLLNKKDADLLKFNNRLKALEAKANKESKRLVALNNTLNNKQANLNALDRKLNNKDLAQNKREAILNTKDKNLKNFDETLKKKNETLNNRDKRLAEYQTELNKKDAYLKGKIKTNEALETKLTRHNEAATKERERLAVLKKQLDQLLLEIKNKYKQTITDVNKHQNQLKGIKP